jgi:hypothetical protein
MMADAQWFSLAKESTNHMATKVWFTPPVHPTHQGSKPRQILVRRPALRSLGERGSPVRPDGGGHRSATSNSAIKGRWTIRDISLFGFTLSLVLLGTILSAHTDRPIFWLLIGRGPIAIGFTLISFFRQGLGRRHGSPAVRSAGDR